MKMVAVEVGVGLTEVDPAAWWFTTLPTTVAVSPTPPLVFPAPLRAFPAVSLPPFPTPSFLSPLNRLGATSERACH